MKKEKITIELDYLQGPIWISDLQTGQPMTGIDIVDNDELLRKINYEISYMYSSYYEFDSHNEPCWFNKEQEKRDKEKRDKEKMLSLLHKLIDRLNEINDGSYEIEDLETPRVMKL